MVGAAPPSTAAGTGTDSGTGHRHWQPDTGSTATATDSTTASRFRSRTSPQLHDSRFLDHAAERAAAGDAERYQDQVLQSPQIRSVDGIKASLKIGERQPTATGSFQPGIGGVGINPLVNTQFTYIDVGVNVDLLPHIHDNGDVDARRTGHLERDSHVNLGGIDQPVIGQRKVTHDIRMKEGEVNLLGGLINSRTPSRSPAFRAVQHPALGAAVLRRERGPRSAAN